MVRRAASVVAIFVLLLMQLGSAPARRLPMRPCCCKAVAADATLSKASCCVQPPATRVAVRAGAVSDSNDELVVLHSSGRVDGLPRGVAAIVAVVDRRRPPGIGCGPPYRLRI